MTPENYRQFIFSVRETWDFMQVVGESGERKFARQPQCRSREGLCKIEFPSAIFEPMFEIFTERGGHKTWYDEYH